MSQQVIEALQRAVALARKAAPLRQPSETEIEDALAQLEQQAKTHDTRYTSGQSKATAS